MAFTKPTCSDQRREGPVNDRYSARAITANARTNPVPTNSPGSPSHSHQASESSGISAATRRVSPPEFRQAERRPGRYTASPPTRKQRVWSAWSVPRSPGMQRSATAKLEHHARRINPAAGLAGPLSRPHYPIGEFEGDSRTARISIGWVSSSSTRTGPGNSARPGQRYTTRPDTSNITGLPACRGGEECPAIRSSPSNTAFPIMTERQEPLSSNRSSKITSARAVVRL